MRKTGTLQTWNDDRGFGLISPLEGTQPVFVHISQFPKDGSRPTVGEKLTYIEASGSNKRPQATKVERTAFPKSRTPKAKTMVESESGSWLGTLLVIVLVTGALTFGYRQYEQYTLRLQLEALPASSAPIAASSTASNSKFTCDGRTHCSQMTSCAEATWYINNCPGMQMDGDHDGVPCEQQLCN